MVSKHEPPNKTHTHEVLLLPGLYNEALKLVVDSHEYFYRQASKDQSKLSSRERIMYTSEMSRITIRLSCVLAWLMARKAVLVGKLTDAEAESRHRLEHRDVSMHQHIEAESMLPRKMLDLLDKSFELYQRVQRLDSMANKN